MFDEKKLISVEMTTFYVRPGSSGLIPLQKDRPISLIGTLEHRTARLLFVNDIVIHAEFVLLPFVLERARSWLATQRATEKEFFLALMRMRDEGPTWPFKDTGPMTLAQEVELTRKRKAHLERALTQREEMVARQMIETSFQDGGITLLSDRRDAVQLKASAATRATLDPPTPSDVYPNIPIRSDRIAATPTGKVIPFRRPGTT